ncbi:glycerophosphodiester phosphodiesterase family protein [Algoriphagus resistens]|uniref:glycerophosphodiester phosphodiesterase family protein n=1 Tax=Algoriphagus resistens TaxID=1750590 RepID=UPI000B335E96|nr:glycerophosphodiester phosphodiesterase family protein [Algoriphagus resistens]
MLSRFLTFLYLLFSLTLSAQELHRIAPNSAAELHAFFQYQEGNAPIISGHRGGKEPGYPENSLEAMEYTLQFTPAIFEVDPRITKDSVIVLFHDASLERTSNGQGKLIDHTFEELRQLQLMDVNGVLTPYKIPSLEESIAWAKGKTILNLDHKDVPLAVTARTLIDLDALSHVMITVHAPEEAAFYLSQDSRFMFSAFIRNFEELEAYEKAGIPWSQLIAYVGPLSKPENQALYDALHQRGVKVMISAAPSYDKETDVEKRAEDYRKVIIEGADVLESDYPIAVGKAFKELKNK